MSPAEAPDGLRVLLGEQDGRTWFAVIADAGGRVRASKDEWFPLRGLLPHLADAGAGRRAAGLPRARPGRVALRRPASARAAAAPLEPRAAGHELVCTDCGKPQFPRTDPAVIMVVAHGEPGSEDERCLLGRQAVWPEGRYSTLAGFCEPGETLEDAVRREVAEEVGVVVGDVDYFGNQPWPLPASLMLGFVGRAETTEIDVDERRDRGRALVHPRGDEGRGRGRHAGAARRRLDQPRHWSSTGTAARSPASW